MRTVPILTAAALALLAPASADASSSAAFETEGGSIRLVTSGLAGDDGLIRGALVITLKPTWKTYWRDPGSAGVPPQIDIGRSVNIEGAEIGYPAPEWHDDGYGAWAGYSRSVSLPVSFAVPEPDRYSLIEADVFLGVCQEICIPVQADLAVEPGSDPENPGDASIVDAAFASLPMEARAGFQVADAHVDGERLAIDVETPENPGETVLFVAAAGGYAFGIPKRIAQEDGRPDFVVPLLAKPEKAHAPVEIPYTLVSDGKSVAGTFRLP